MEKIIEVFREKEVKKCFLQVRVSNSRAIKFYKKLGFKIAKRIKKYYIDEDAYVMEKEI